MSSLRLLGFFTLMLVGRTAWVGAAAGQEVIAEAVQEVAQEVGHEVAHEVAQEAASEEDSAPLPRLARVRVGDDGSGFVRGDVAEPLVMWGFNYLGQHGNLAEEDWHTADGWARIEEDFREMKRLGANVVRWHLQFETYMAGPEEPDPEQLGRLRRLLELADAEGLYLDLTGLGCYRRERVPEWYDALSEAERWEVQGRFWEAIAKTCAGSDAVFCYCLMNEPVVTQAPEGEHPWLTGELGGFYFVQRISNAPGDRDNRGIAADWVARMVDAVRRHDRTTMVTVGAIPWAMVWPNAKPVFYSPRALEHLDFVSIHVYPESGEVDRALAALEVYALGKPIVVEEIFPLRCSIEELDEFIVGGSGEVDGWISHYFGHTPAEHRSGAEPAGPIVADFLDYWHRKRDSLAHPLTSR